MTKNQEILIRKEMQELVDRWKGKPEAPFMSREYIERRTDRVKYLSLKKKLAIKVAGYKVNRAYENIVEAAKDVFEIND